mgnify:CR=1 FL=1
MLMENKSTPQTTPWLNRPVFSNLQISWETLLFGLILILAVVSRFYDLGARVISHDETSHVYYSWRLFRGMGYNHDPITHGPFQFHFLAFIYFLFGDSDFTARIPAALTSVATIAFLWNYRRYLGKWGTLAAALMTLISPFMLYYGRYVRNESFVALFGVIALWAVLRYLETSAPRYLYWLTAATVLHFATKETAFIYTAQAMIFLGLVYIFQLSQRTWEKQAFRGLFLISVLAAGLLIGGALIVNMAAPEATPGGESVSGPNLAVFLPLALSAVALLMALVFSILGFTWKKLSALPSFSALLLLGTLVLPQLAPFPSRFLGWNPLDYSSQGMLRTGILVAVLSVIAVIVGLAWNPREWLINAAVFYIPFTILYTTIFTNGPGFFTGLVGSLGYWLEQQGVERGSQPWYYYWLIQIPVYEYLPALGSLAALIGGAFVKLRKALKAEPSPVQQDAERKAPVFALLAFWVITSLIAYPVAGEKMPWLTVHIAFPMILLAAWGFDRLIQRFHAAQFRENRGWLTAGLVLIFLVSLSSALGELLGPGGPFQGQQLQQLRQTGTFMTTLLITAASGAALWFLLQGWRIGQFLITLVLVGFGILILLTTHTAVQAAYINYDSPEEYLVYAHGARGVKEALQQIEELSRRTTDGLAMEVAFDNETTYPYWWYLRNYSNQRYYAESPTRDLRSAPAILVGNDNYNKLEPVVGNAYYAFSYNRIVWPNQDYYGLTWERIWNVLTDSALRQAIFKIWLNRDYTQYAQVKGQDISLANWSPADEMRLYIRKDIAAKVWNYGPADLEFADLEEDPYQDQNITLAPVRQLDQLNLNQPRNMASAPDGSLYVVDTGNHRVLHVSPEGELLNSWGSFSATEGQIGPPGTFNEPWGIAVGPGGSIYVADTWNHRVQKFTPEGEYLTSWGQFGQQEAPDAFWGPRDIVVDEQGHVYVTDTGNKRVAVFNENGSFLLDFGGGGFENGQFSEPVGLALGPEGRLFVADTWNQRVQVFAPDEDGIARLFENKWDIIGWYGQSLENKPYLAASQNGRVYVTDPEGNRVLAFTTAGEFLYSWGGENSGALDLNLPVGVETDGSGGLWLADSRNNRLLFYNPPAQPEP